MRVGACWAMFRKGSITASNFGAVIKSVCSGRKPCKSLMKALYGKYTKKGVEAIQWGLQNEEIAISRYEKAFQEYVVASHLSGTMGASPDGIVNEYKIIEVKCPYSARDKPLVELVDGGAKILQATGTHPM